MMYFILKGGPVMWPILLASVFGFAIVIERFIVLRRAFRIDMEAFSKAVCNKVLAGKNTEAMAFAQRYAHHPLGAMFVATLENSDLPREELEKMLERMGNHAVNKLEVRLGALVSITGIEPLMGFLGTITGLIRAFMAWEKAGNDITVSDLAGGIYEAMITTAAGLIIAIPLYLAYNYFISRNKYFVQELTDYSGQLLEAIARGRLL